MRVLNRLCSFSFIVLFLVFILFFVACGGNIDMGVSSVSIMRDGKDICGESSFYYGQELSQTELKAVYTIGNIEQKYQLLDYRTYLTNAKFVSENGDEMIFEDDLSGFTIETNKIGYYEFTLNYENNEINFKINIIKKSLNLELSLDGERSLKQGTIPPSYFKVFGSEGITYKLYLCEYSGEKTAEDYENINEFLMSLDPKTSFSNITEVSADELAELDVGTYYVFAKVCEGVGNFESYSNVEMFEVTSIKSINLKDSIQKFEYEGVQEVLFFVENEESVTLKQLNTQILSGMEINLKLKLNDDVIQDFSNALITNQLEEEISGKWLFDEDVILTGSQLLNNGEIISAKDILSVDLNFSKNDYLSEKYVIIKFVSSDDTYVYGFFIAKFNILEN